MIEIKSPDSCLGTLYKKLSAPEKTAFLWAVLVGLMTHLYAFTNKLYNYDELYATPGNYGVGIQNNRWFLEYLGRQTAKMLGGSYSLPLFNGLLSILLLACSALLVVRMFQMKSRILAMLVGGLMTAFPAVTCMFFFMFTALYYSIGIFLSVLAAYLLVRHAGNWLCNAAAAVILACSVGIYQAYFPNAAALCLMAMILSCAFDEEKTQSSFWRSARHAAVLGVGMLLYFILNKGFHRYLNIDGAMGSYQGLDTMGQLTADGLMQGLKMCYQNFLGLCREEILYLNTIVSVMKSYFGVMLLLAGSMLFLICVRKGGWGKKILMLIGFLLFPVALFLIYVMAPDAYVYTLMIYPAVFLLVFLLVWVDRFAEGMPKYKTAAALQQWAAAGLAGFILFIYIWYGNGCYMSMEYVKYHDMAYFETMVTQIKSLPGYRDDMQVVMAGRKIEDETHQIGSLLDDVFGMEGKSESNINAYARDHIIAKYLGFVPEFGGYDEIRRWMERDEVKAMNTYPDSGSIAIIDDTIIVKLADEEVE